MINERDTMKKRRKVKYLSNEMQGILDRYYIGSPRKNRFPKLTGDEWYLISIFENISPKTMLSFAHLLNFKAISRYNTNITQAIVDEYPSYFDLRALKANVNFKGRVTLGANYRYIKPEIKSQGVLWKEQTQEIRKKRASSIEEFCS